MVLPHPEQILRGLVAFEGSAGGGGPKKEDDRVAASFLHGPVGQQCGVSALERHRAPGPEGTSPES
jgi:hypothetical protein